MQILSLSLIKSIFLIKQFMEISINRCIFFLYAHNSYLNYIEVIILLVSHAKMLIPWYSCCPSSTNLLIRAKIITFFSIWLAVRYMEIATYKSSKCSEIASAIMTVANRARYEVSHCSSSLQFHERYTNKIV